MTDNADGDDSRVIVDRAEPFIRDAARHGDPFPAPVWFHAPHTPVVARPEYRAKYARFSEEEQHYYGCATAMDEQVGRINAPMQELGIEQQTMIWFCSDKGPTGSEALANNGRNQGLTAAPRGRKRSLFNGGIQVPALVKWLRWVRPGSGYGAPLSTLD